MHEMGLHANRPTRKCAKITGEVLGKYHPHGDVPVYDALVRMAQPFSMRYPLVDGQGNFGSVDGDPPAAMRYTEARLSRIAAALLEDIDKETVDFRPNYDESEVEPEVLPTRIPNLLVNGSEGIAVGMASKVPPHNLREIVEACILLVQSPATPLAKLIEIVQGPDFPTGGLILGRQGILDYFLNGRGSIKVRALAKTEAFGKDREAIIVTELPYQVNKARLIEYAAGLVNEKKLEGISEIRDESDRDGMRIVFELKRGEQAEVVLNNLYKHTQMQVNFGVILLAIVNGQPRELGLLDAIKRFIDHRLDVVRRRTDFLLRKARDREHLLLGFKKALDNLDAVITLIRAAKTPREARDGLIARFEFTEKQAQAIIELQLQRLTKRRVCEGALRVRTGDEPPDPALELQGVDVGSGGGLRQRWFGIADAGAAPDPDLLPRSEDAWWRDFAGGSDSLLRVEQWFSGPKDTSPFQTLLAGGNLAFDGRRSVLKQWLDVSGPSLVALRIREALQPGATAP